MHRNIYTASFAAVAITAVQDLLTLITAATSRIAVNRIEIWNHSDFGDAQAEILPYTIKRTPTIVAVGSGGTAPTVRNVKGWGRAAVTTARANDTTQAATGTPETIYAGGWNLAAGLLYAPKFGGDADIDERLTLDVSSRLVVSLDGAPADSITCSGTITFEEIGLLG